MPFRRYRSRRRARPARRRPFRGRSRLAAVRRPTFLRSYTSGNGPAALRVRRGGKAYPRLIGTGAAMRQFKFSDTHFQMWGTNYDPTIPSETRNSVQPYQPFAIPATVAAVYQLFDIDAGGVRELHKRATDRIILKRLDLDLEITLGEAAQSGAGRLTLIWDRTPDFSLSAPSWHDIFEPAPAYPTVPAVQGTLSGYSRWVDVNPNHKTDLSTYLVPDQRNRFEILYQQTVHLERGAPVHSFSRAGATYAPGDWFHYAGGLKSQVQIRKSLYLNRMVTYTEGSSGDNSGKWNEIVSGCIWVCWQSTNTRHAATSGDNQLDTECRLELKCRNFFTDVQ